MAVLVERAAMLRPFGGATVLDCFAAIPDPRCARGVRHPLATILGLCTAAALAGQISLVEITDWVAGAPQEVLAGLGCRQRGPDDRLVAPHPDTVERVFALLGAQHLADGVGAYLAARAGVGCVGAPIAAPTVLPAVAVDGKAVRGAIGPDGQIPYLLAAATHGSSVVIAERLVGAKTNEVPEFAPLLRGLAARTGDGVGGCVFTMDAGHTVRAHATLITSELLGHYVMTVKRNTPTLYARLDALGWSAVPITHQTQETGHGRRERRTIQVLDAPADLGFPGAAQVFLIERYTTRTVRKRTKGSRKYKTVQVRTAVAVFGITSLSSREAAAEHLAGYVRGHWAIENKIHWVRDVTFREDASQVRTPSRFRVMATLRNLVIGLIRQEGYTRIAATIRQIRHDPHLLLTVLGLHRHPANTS
ncbi:MAG: ISAs1 family transposase [Pseudonocardia sp.]|nr:ISAs1 family transposase [Pseudonocardia sp.]MDN5933348.1 ISAs1 family transposase [Pseudonocardia sp.]